jgi:hypothetical protein
MLHIGRRNAIIGTVAAAILAKLGTGCDADSAVPAPATIPTREKSVHVELGSFATMGPDKLAKVRVHVAGGVYELAAHTAETRERFFPGDALRGARVSHFAEGVRFSTVGAQSYRVGYHNDAGCFTKLFAGIHVPDDEPTHLADEDQRAVYAVYHTPVLLTLDTETAAKVIGHIKSTVGYRDLKVAINAAGAAVTPENAELGDSGWIKGVFSVDKAGAKIPRTKLKDGTVVPGKYQFTWVLADSVADAARIVAEQAQQLMHSDETLEGKKYGTTDGVGVHAEPRRLRAGAQAASDAFVFADQGVFRGRRAFSVEEDNGALTLTVTNPNAVGTLVSMVARDVSGKPLGDPHTIGYVAGTFYPGLARLAGPSTMSFPLKLPTGAASVDLLSSALALNLGDFPGIRDDQSLSETAVSDFLGNALFSSMLDFFLPITLLAAGGGGPEANRITGKVRAAMLKGAGVAILINIAKTVCIDVFAATAGELTAKTVFANIGKIGEAMLAAIPTMLGTAALAEIAAVIIEGLAEIIAEDAIEDALPIVGWVLEAIQVATALVQLAIELVHVATGQMLNRSSLTPAHPVSVVVKPNPDQSTIFPRGASSYRLTVTPSARLPMESTGTFDPSPGSTTVDVPHVPLLGTLTIDVTLFDRANHVVGHRTVKVDNGTVRGEPQKIELELDLFAVPLGPSSRLSHFERLDVTAGGRAWTKTATGPTADENALSCDVKAARVCQVLGISASLLPGQVAYAFRTPMACAGGAVRSQLHVASISNPTLVRTTPCGSEGLSRILLGATREEKSLVIARSKEGPYAVFPFEADGVIPTDLDLVLANAVGELRGDMLAGARRHADGYVIALTDLGVEAVHVESGTRRHPEIFARRGLRLGQISQGVAVAPLRGVRGYLLLEQATYRLQAVDFEGNPLKVFGARSAIDLPRDAGRSYLDVEVDHAGHIWLLSTASNGSAKDTFRVDVYDRGGVSLVSFEDVNAKALAVDPLGTLYTLDFENAIGPGTYPEPIVSQWTYA